MRAPLLFLLALLAAAAWPAAANAQAKVCAGHPSDPSVVCAPDQARTVDVCDRHADGHRAYARVVTQATYPRSSRPTTTPTTASQAAPTCTSTAPS